MRKTERFPRSRLIPDDVKRIIDAAVKKGIRVLTFTGGEIFLFFDEIVDLIKYAGDAGIKYILTGTNGFMFMNHASPDFTGKITEFVEKLAETRIYSFWISIDSSVPEVHEKMRGLPGVIKGIEKSIPVFHKHGIYPVANLAINRNINGFPDYTGFKPEDLYEYFKDAFRGFYNFILNMGFTSSIAAYPMSTVNAHEDVLPVYMAASSENVVGFSIGEKVSLIRAFLDVIPEFRQKIRIFNPRCSAFSLIRQYTAGGAYCYPCRGGLDFFFINARNGDTYPCGYRGQENLGKFWDLDFPNRNHRPSCVICDWECFRDPSEMYGPVQDIFTRPLGFVNRVITDYQYMRLWFNDILYYRACKFFDGRVPPDYKRLSKFTDDTPLSSHTSDHGTVPSYHSQNGDL